MEDEIVWLNFEEIAVSTGFGGGSSGTVILLQLEGIFSDFEGEYTVYWPTDGVRVFQQTVSFEAALFIAALLRDQRTKVHGDLATDYPAPAISVPRRTLDEDRYLSPSEAKSPWPFVRDRLLSGDIWLQRPDNYEVLQGDGIERNYRIDATTIPR